VGRSGATMGFVKTHAASGALRLRRSRRARGHSAMSMKDHVRTAAGPPHSMPGPARPAARRFLGDGDVKHQPCEVGVEINRWFRPSPLERKMRPAA